MSELTIDPEVSQANLPDIAVGDKIQCTATVSEVGEGGIKATVDDETIEKAPDEEAAPADDTGTADGAEGETAAAPAPPKRSAAAAAVLKKGY